MSHSLRGHSPKITSKLQQFQNQTTTQSGAFAVMETLPVDIPSIMGQRTTQALTLLKWFEAEGGYNPGLSRPVSVVRVPLETATAWINLQPEDQRPYYRKGIIGDYLYLRWDGDHRRWLYKIWKNNFVDSAGNFIEWGDLSYPCLVYDSPTVEVANTLFVKIQKTRSKSLSPEEFFINSYLGKDANALVMAQRLKRVGLRIKGDGVDVGEANGKIIKVRDAEWAFDIVDKWHSTRAGTLVNNITGNQLFQVSPTISEADELVKEAVQVIDGLFPNITQIPSTMLLGILYLKVHRPNMFVNGCGSAFRTYMAQMAGAFKEPDKFVSYFKEKGGNKHNKEAKSFAYGLSKEFVDDKTLMTLHYSSKIILLKFLHDELGLDKNV